MAIVTVRTALPRRLGRTFQIFVNPVGRVADGNTVETNCCVLSSVSPSRYKYSMFGPSCLPPHLRQSSSQTPSTNSQSLPSNKNGKQDPPLAPSSHHPHRGSARSRHHPSTSRAHDLTQLPLRILRRQHELVLLLGWHLLLRPHARSATWREQDERWDLRVCAQDTRSASCAGTHAPLVRYFQRVLLRVMIFRSLSEAVAHASLRRTLHLVVA